MCVFYDLRKLETVDSWNDIYLTLNTVIRLNRSWWPFFLSCKSFPSFCVIFHYYSGNIFKSYKCTRGTSWARDRTLISCIAGRCRKCIQVVVYYQFFPFYWRAVFLGMDIPQFAQPIVSSLGLLQIKLL